MLPGTGMVAATAAFLYPDLTRAAIGMEQGGRARASTPQARVRFDMDYEIFLDMYEQRGRIDSLKNRHRKRAG